MKSSIHTTAIIAFGAVSALCLHNGMTSVGNLIQNGSFEQGSFQIEAIPPLPTTGYWGHVQVGSTNLQGWSVSLSPDDPDGRITTAGLEWVGSISTSSPHPDGSMMIDLVNDTDFFRVGTLVSTTPGRRYRLTLWASAGGVMGLRVWGSTVRLSQSVPIVEDFTWRPVAFSFTADNTVTQLELWAVQAGTTMGSGSGPFLDAVSVVPIEDLTLGIDLYAGLNLTGTPGRTYRIEYATAADPTAWQSLTNLVLPTTPYLFIDQTRPASSGERFYRAVELP